jgi:hypothetical protein
VLCLGSGHHKPKEFNIGHILSQMDQQRGIGYEGQCAQMQRSVLIAKSQMDPFPPILGNSKLGPFQEGLRWSSRAKQNGD